MIKILIISLLLFFDFALAKNICYSIKTEVGLLTPIYPDNMFSQRTCKLKELPLNFSGNEAYIGCYKTKKEVYNRYDFLRRVGFHFKNEKIVKITPTQDTKFIIFPYFAKSTQKKLTKYKKEFLSKLDDLTPKKLIKKIPKHFYGIGIEVKNIDSISLLPIPNIFAYYKYYKKHHLSMKMIVLYNGIYSLDNIYNKFPNLIKKISKNRFLIKVPIYISKSASLVIQNSKVLLESKPKPIFMMYHGNLYINNSKITTYNTETKSYAKREKIAKDEILLVGKQKPRPYFLGLSNSYTLFLNSIFRGLGFHNSVSTFGISLAQLPTSILHVSNILNFLRTKRPKGAYVGNEIYDSMMGFYCANAKNVNIVGNYIHDNVIYNIDPYDYSENLLIARNLLSKAHYAHGVIISRGVTKTFIAQNISIKNHSNGIMLDRMSPDNIVYDNLTFANGYMGISFQESDNNIIEKNIAAYNLIDGIMIRNSLNILIKKNQIFKNGKNGIEVMSKNIDDTIYRDFRRDPYHKATSCVITKNSIRNNYFNQITVKNGAAIKFYNNYFKKKDINLFGDNLSLFTDKIINNNYNFKLYGAGDRFHAISVDKLKIRDTFYDIFFDLSYYNDTSGLSLAEIYRLLNLHDLVKNELQREASNLVAKALEAYAFYELGANKNRKNFIKYLSYIVESAIMKNKDAILSVCEIKYVLPVNRADIREAFKMAKDRMEKGEIFDNKDKKGRTACHFSKFSKKVIKSYIDIFMYKYKKSKVKDILEYFNILNKHFSLMPPNIFKKMKEIYREKNLPKIRYYHFIKYKLNEMRKDKLCKRYLIKNKYFQKETKGILKNDLQKNIYKYKPLFEHYLSLINRYRNKKLNFKQILNILNIQGKK